MPTRRELAAWDPIPYFTPEWYVLAIPIEMKRRLTPPCGYLTVEENLVGIWTDSGDV